MEEMTKKEMPGKMPDKMPDTCSQQSPPMPSPGMTREMPTIESKPGKEMLKDHNFYHQGSK